MLDNQNVPPIHFYIPRSSVIDYGVLEIDNFWDTVLTVDSHDDPRKPKFPKISNIVWIVQTYLYLKEAGFPCSLVHSMPKEGIVIAHTLDLKAQFTPTETSLVISVQTEKEKVYPYAQFHIVQNKNDPLFFEPYQKYFAPIYIRHWTQPCLIERNPERGDLFENVAYMGRNGVYDRLIKAMIRELNLNYKLNYSARQWHDYSEVDCVVAVREFKEEFNRKPPTKLFNAWLAGVPAILGKESGYQGERKSDLDYLEAGSLEELRERIVELRDSPALRAAMVANGRERAKEIAPEAITKEWIDFLTVQAIPAYEEWVSSPQTREAFFRNRKFAARIV